MLKINLKLPTNYDAKIIENAICAHLKIKQNQLKKYKLLKLSVDARDKSNVHYQASFAVDVGTLEKQILKRKKGVSIYKNTVYTMPICSQKSTRPIVVGAGPAGLFCAYILAQSGLCPLILERGEKIENRVKKVEDFHKNGTLDTESNIQFGEGGAGTFSDGKLNTGVNDARIPFVFETFVKHGAPNEILWRQKPHIGTDILRDVIVNMRREIESLGGEFRFGCRLENLNIKNNNVYSLTVCENGVNYEIACDRVVLALGHSARDTVKNLFESGVEITQKPFAIGVRIEHSQDFINRAQYGEIADINSLPVADYKLATHLPNGRNVYTFCMCPGGFVVNASSEENSIAVNGMSNFDRGGNNANSAILVNVTTDDFGSSHALAGIEFQRKIERSAYSLTGSYNPPAQTFGALLGNGTKIGKVTPTCNVTECDFSSIFPEFIVDSLKGGILEMDKKIKGFADYNSVLTAPETRSSSPVRITRNECGISNFGGVYPCGEGAGYAGGITSSAVDGIKTAEKIIASINSLDL